MRISTALERLAIALASLCLSVGLIALLSGYFAGKDAAGVTGSASAIGQRFSDLGHAALPPGELRPPYNSDPPTSGAHVPEPVNRSPARLSDDQLLSALQAGDVVIAYGSEHPPPGLGTLARSVGSQFSPALAASGEAVILARRPGTRGVVGLAWTHLIRVGSPRDPALRDFAQYWLGRGAP